MVGNESKIVILDLRKVISKTTLGRSTTLDYVKKGKFPAPIRIGDRAIGWIESEVDAWLQERVKASRAAASVGGAQ